MKTLRHGTAVLLVKCTVPALVGSAVLTCALSFIVLKMLDVYREESENNVMFNIRGLNSFASFVEKGLIDMTEMCSVQHQPGLAGSEKFVWTTNKIGNMVVASAMLRKCFVQDTAHYLFSTNDIAGSVQVGTNNPPVLHTVHSSETPADVPLLLATETRDVSDQSVRGVLVKRHRGYYHIFHTGSVLSVDKRLCGTCPPACGIELRTKGLLVSSGVSNDTAFAIKFTVHNTTMVLDTTGAVPDYLLALPCGVAAISSPDYTQTPLLENGMCILHFRPLAAVSFPTVLSFISSESSLAACGLYLLLLFAITAVSIHRSTTVFCSFFASILAVPTLAHDFIEAHYELAPTLPLSPLPSLNVVLLTIQDLFTTLHELKPYAPHSFDNSEVASPISSVSAGDFELCTSLSFRQEMSSEAVAVAESVYKMQVSAADKTTNCISKKMREMRVQRATVVIAVTLKYQMDFWMKQPKECREFETMQTAFIDHCCAAARAHSGAIDSVAWDVILIHFTNVGKSVLAVHTDAANALLEMSSYEWPRLQQMAPAVAFGCASGPSICGQVGQRQRGHGVYSGVRLMSTNLAAIGLKNNVLTVCDQAMKLQCATSHNFRPIDILTSRLLSRGTLPPSSIVYELCAKAGKSFDGASEWMYEVELHESLSKEIDTAFTLIQKGEAANAVCHLEKHMLSNVADRTTHNFTTKLRAHLTVSPHAPYYFTEPMECRTYWVEPDGATVQLIQAY